MTFASPSQTSAAVASEGAAPSPLTAGIIGTGFIGRVHAQALRRAGGTLAAVASSSPERSRAAATRLRADRAVDSAAELIALDDIEVVHICAPNYLHEPLAVAALQAGKHVVCEKPLALSMAAARRMTALAAARGLVATVPFVYRYHPLVFEARARIAAGRLGRVNLVHGGYLQDWLAGAEDTDWRVDPSTGGASRAFADIGSHWCDLLEFVTGDRITAVLARTAVTVARPAITQSPTEDQATLMFETAGGASGVAVVSQTAPGHKNHLHLEISGSEATVSFEIDNPTTLRWATREIDARIWPDAELAASAARIGTLPAGHPQGYQDAFDMFVADTYSLIGGAHPDGVPTFNDGARAAAVVEAVLRSAATGTWTEVER